MLTFILKITLPNSGLKASGFASKIVDINNNSIWIINSNSSNKVISGNIKNLSIAAKLKNLAYTKKSNLIKSKISDLVKDKMSNLVKDKNSVRTNFSRKGFFIFNFKKTINYL